MKKIIIILIVLGIATAFAVNLSTSTVPETTMDWVSNGKVVMGVSNTAGTLAGIVGVDLTGKLLEAAKTADSDLSTPESWRAVFFIPGLLCFFSSLIFLQFSTGERIFD